jgi:hypothetical protein
MGTTTTRLGLFKPDPDPITGDDVDVTDLNDNADAMDSAVGYILCTNATRPASPWQGMPIYETDTGRAYVRVSSVWVEIALPAGLRTSMDVQRSSSTSAILQGKVTGDTQQRVAVDAAGSIGWGGGSGAADITLSRGGAGFLLTNGYIRSLQASALASFVGGLTGDSVNRSAIYTDGKIEWGSGSATRDTNLYRSAADTLKTDDTFIAANVLAGDSAWVIPTLLNSWVNYDATLFTGARYRKLNTGMVVIQGLVKSGTGPTSTFFTLPAGYRPLKQLIFPAIANNTFARVDVQADGQVVWSTGGTNAFIDLNLSFYAEQ